MRRIAVAVAGCGLLLGLTLPSPGRTAACETGPRPAATLLFPYFEVDLSGATDRTTLVAIGNSSSVPTLAHEVLWTDRGIATLSFDLYLGPNEVRTISLTDVFVQGSLPSTHPVGVEGCSDPITLPPLGEAQRTALRLQHTGQPIGAGQLCWGSPRSDGLATGFMTVDTANRCSATIQLPSDTGYFVAGGEGVASNANTLYGDWFFVDGDGNHAQGDAAVHLVADAARFPGTDSPETFWMLGDDNRSPLSRVYRSRYLLGGAFDGGTELVLFLPFLDWFDRHAVGCGQAFGPEDRYLVYSIRNESGETTGPWSFPIRDELAGRVSARVTLADLPFSLPSGFGTIDLEVRPRAPVPPGWGVPDFGPVPSHVTTLHTASGRFSVGLGAVPVRGFCGGDFP